MTTFRRRTGSRGEPPEARFLNEGIDFKAKILGETVVPVARGEKMSQEALKGLKTRMRSSGKHKQKIIINISTDGLKVRDEKSQEELQHHRIQHISFVSNDPSDSRVFGLVNGRKSSQGGYILHGFKTEKNASSVTGTIKELFQLVYKYKREVTRQAASQQEVKPAPASVVAAAESLVEPVAISSDHSARKIDESTNEDIFSDLASVRAQIALQQPGSLLEKPKNSLFDIASSPDGKSSSAKKTDMGLIESLGDDLFGDDLYQVPNSKPAQIQSPNEDMYQVPSSRPVLNQASVIREWNDLAAELDQIGKELSFSEPETKDTPPFPLSSVFGSDPFASSASFSTATTTTPSSNSDPFSPSKEPTLPKGDATNGFTSVKSEDIFGSSSFSSNFSNQKSTDPFGDSFSSPSPKKTNSFSGQPKPQSDPFAVPVASEPSTSFIPRPQQPKKTAAADDDRFAALRALAVEDKDTRQDPFGGPSTDPFGSSKTAQSGTANPFTSVATGQPFNGSNPSHPFASSFSPPPAPVPKQPADAFSAFAVLSPSQVLTPSHAGAAAFPAEASAVVQSGTVFSDPFSVSSQEGKSDPFGQSVQPPQSDLFASKPSSVPDPFAPMSNPQSLPPLPQVSKKDPFGSIEKPSNSIPSLQQFPPSNDSFVMSQVTTAMKSDSDPFAAFDSPGQDRRPTVSQSSTVSDPFALTVQPSPTNPFASGPSVSSATSHSPVNPFASYQQQSPNPFASVSGQDVFGSSGFG